MDVSSSILGWISELKNRCIRLITMLKDLEVLDDVNELRDSAIASLKSTYKELKDLERDDTLLQVHFQAQAISKYQELFRAVVLIEEIITPVLLGYDDYDHRGSLWLRKFAAETNFPAEILPFITVKSSSYYWTYPDLKILGMPIGDLEGLLGWPDIVHELGHGLLSANPDFLVLFSSIVKQHFSEEHHRILDLGGKLEAHSKKSLQIAQKKWGNTREGTWREELACDLIATYFMGASYGWQHSRLVTNRDNHPYLPLPNSSNNSSIHPADFARMEAIIEMLKIMRLNADVKVLENHWQHILKSRHYSKIPQGFRNYYPLKLIQELARVVYEQCQNQKLISFVDQDIKKEFAIVGLVRQAWAKYENNPTQYGEWEKAKASEFWQYLEADEDSRMIG